MRCAPLIASLVFLASLAGAAEAPSAAPGALPAVLVPVETVRKTPAAPLAMSQHVAATLAALTPKFSTPAVDVSTPPPDAPEVPKNQIIRLPSYVVSEHEVRIPPERAVLTYRGKLELAKKLHPGVGPSWLGNDGIALFMLWEQQRLEDMAELADLIKATSFQDPKKASAMKKAVDNAFMRDPQFGQ